MLRYSSATKFLLGKGFRIAAPFENGVPYLSREEEARARANAMSKWSPKAYADVIVPLEDDTEAQDLVRTTREDIESWLANDRVRL